MWRTTQPCPAATLGLGRQALRCLDCLILGRLADLTHVDIDTPVTQIVDPGHRVPTQVISVLFSRLAPVHIARGRNRAGSPQLPGVKSDRSHAPTVSQRHPSRSGANMEHVQEPRSLRRGRRDFF
jgi:hypothetical protein